jgi:hypothetical protein
MQQYLDLLDLPVQFRQLFGEVLDDGKIYLIFEVLLPELFVVVYLFLVVRAYQFLNGFSITPEEVVLNYDYS